MSVFDETYESVPNDLKRFNGNYMARKSLDRIERQLFKSLYDTVRDRFKIDFKDNAISISLIIGWLLLRRGDIAWPEKHRKQVNKHLRDAYYTSQRQNKYFRRKEDKDRRRRVREEIREQYRIEEYGNTYTYVQNDKTNIQELGDDGRFVDDRYAETVGAVNDVVTNLVDDIIDEVKAKETETITKQELATIINDKGKQEIEGKLEVIAITETHRTYSGARAIEGFSRGIDSYIWRTQLDDRVRPLHRALEGTLQSLNNPPIAGVYGDRCNPGETIHCRCYYEFIE